MEEISKDELEHISNFHILTFSPNPDKDRVRIWIPSADNFKTSLKRKTFIDLLTGIVGYEIRSKLMDACNFYGGYFMVDRVHKSVKALSSIRDPINYSATALKKAKLGETKLPDTVMDEYTKAWSILQNQLINFKGF
jgi:hypothetical protein